MLLPLYIAATIINILAKSNNYNIHTPKNTDMDIRVRREIDSNGIYNLVKNINGEKDEKSQNFEINSNLSKREPKKNLDYGVKNDGDVEKIEANPNFEANIDVVVQDNGMYQGRDVKNDGHVVKNDMYQNFDINNDINDEPEIKPETVIANISNRGRNNDDRIVNDFLKETESYADNTKTKQEELNVNSLFLTKLRKSNAIYDNSGEEKKLQHDLLENAPIRKRRALNSTTVRKEQNEVSTEENIVIQQSCFLCFSLGCPKFLRRLGSTCVPDYD